MIEIRPIVQATGPNNPAKQISVTNWNLGHVLTAAPECVIATDATGAAIEIPIADIGGGGSWGSITGDIADQADLAAALDGKANLAGGNAFTGGQTIDPASYLGVGGTYILDGQFLLTSVGSIYPQITFANEDQSQVLATIYGPSNVDPTMYIQADQLDFGTADETVFYASFSPSVCAFDCVVTIPDEAYTVAWNGKLEAPTKNAVYDKLETVVSSIAGKADVSALANYLPLTGGTLSGTLTAKNGFNYFGPPADGTGSVADCYFYLRNTNVYNQIFFQSTAGGGVSGTMATQAAIASGIGTMWIQASNIQFANLANSITFATIDATGINIPTGATYKINGVPIGGGGGLTDGDKGDVVVGGSGTTLTVESANPADGTFDVTGTIITSTGHVRSPTGAMRIDQIGGTYGTVGAIVDATGLVIDGSSMTAGITLADLAFRIIGGSQKNIRLEARAGSILSPNVAGGWEFQLGTAGTAEIRIGPGTSFFPGTLNATAITVSGSAVATVSALANYLPLTGGTLTGNTTITKTNPVLHLQGDGSSFGTELKLTGGHGDARMLAYAGFAFYVPTGCGYVFNVAGAALVTIDATGINLPTGSTYKINGVAIGGGSADGLGPDGDKGDITVGGTGTTLTIDAGAVTLGKMSTLAANSIIGNNTGSAATPLALSAANVKALLGVTAGDLVASGGNVMIARATATAGAMSEVTMTASTLAGRGATGNVAAIALGATLSMGGAATLGVLSVPNALTFNNGGAGAASGTTFNGSAAQTISYNTIGAQPATPPVVSTTSNATLTPDSTKDMSIRSTQTVNLTVAAPSGTPVDAQGHVLRIKATAAIATVSWNATYRAIGVTLPVSLVSGKTTYVGMIWNALDSFWDVVSVATQA